MSKALASARALHPEDAEAPVVRDDLARPNVVDVLGRERDADDVQRAPPAVDDGADAVARLKLVRLANASLTSTSSGRPGSIQRPRAQVHVVQQRAAAFAARR